MQLKSMLELSMIYLSLAFIVTFYFSTTFLIHDVSCITIRVSKDFVV